MSLKTRAAAECDRIAADPRTRSYSDPAAAAEACAEAIRALREDDTLRETVLLDCQPKSKEDAAYVSMGWLKRVKALAEGRS